MPDYDDIVIPVPEQPISSSLFGKKVRDYIIDLGIRMGIREAAEELPPAVKFAGNGTNLLTASAGVWQNLPTTPASVVITNPSTTFRLVCMVFFGAWMQTNVGNVRASINVTGGVTSDPDPGDNSVAGFGMMPLTSSATPHNQVGVFQLDIPPGAAAVTLTMQGQRSTAAGGTNMAINYPTINVMPQRYEIP
jgi:hypothetical protein